MRPDWIAVIAFLAACCGLAGLAAWTGTNRAAGRMLFVIAVIVGLLAAALALTRMSGRPLHELFIPQHGIAMSTSRPRKPPVPLDGKAVAVGAKNAVQGNNTEQAFLDEVAEAVRQRLLINDPGEDTFAEGVRAEQHWRDHVCPGGENHGLGPYVMPKPQTRKLSKPGEVVEFEEHHVALFLVLTKPVSEALGRFAVRLYRRESAIGWATEWWKWIAGCAAVGWAWAQWGHGQLPNIKAGLTWILGHLL